MTAFVGNTNILELLGLKDSITEAYINDAVVTITVQEKGGDEVIGTSWPLSMDYVAASNGDYRVALAATLELTAGTCYIAKIDADKETGNDRVGHWEFHFIPLLRIN